MALKIYKLQANEFITCRILNLSTSTVHENNIWLTAQRKGCISATFGVKTRRAYASMSIINFVYTESFGSAHTIDFSLLLNFPQDDSPSGGILRPRVNSQISITTQGESPQMGFSKVRSREIKPITYDDTTSCVHAYIGNN
jgi:hypothetical protein